MEYIEFATALIIFGAFIFGAFKLFKKGKPLYFQILICGIGCCLLFNIAVITMTYCDVNETFFNTSFFGLFASNLFLLCANRGALEKLFDEPNKKRIIISILAALMEFALAFIVGWFYFEPTNFVFYAFLVCQLPAVFVVFIVTKRLLSPNDELGIKKCLFTSDIFTLAYCFLTVIDIACWLNFGIVSGIADLFFSFVVLGFSISLVKGAEKWNF